MDTHGNGVRGPGGWPATVEEALAEQQRVRGLADLTAGGPAPGDVRLIAGVDVSYAKDGDALVAAAVVLDADTLETVEVALVAGTVSFPYVPGLLAFRELPSVMRALESLKTAPELVVCDGYGIAHPRRAGLAVQLGVLTGLPCFGVAKTPFVFDHRPPGERRGDSSPLTAGAADAGPAGGTAESADAATDAAADREVVGRAVRTQEGVRPVFVSVGHAIGLDNACAHTLRLAPRYRLPETTRRADHLSRARLRELTWPGSAAQSNGG